MTKKDEKKKTYKYEGIRLFIAVPSTDMVHADFAMALAGLANHSTAENIQIALNNTKSADICRTRNGQVYQAKKARATHLLFIDSDMVFKPWAAQRLLDVMLDNGESIVGITVPKRIYPYYQVAKGLDGERLKITPENSNKIIECSELGTGMVLIDMEVFEDVKFPWFDSYYKDDKDGNADITQAVSEDLSFFYKAQEAGHRAMCDMALSMDTKHVGAVQFDFTSEDFFADAIELRRQKEQDMLNERLQKELDKPVSVGTVPVEGVEKLEAANG